MIETLDIFIAYILKKNRERGERTKRRKTRRRKGIQNLKDFKEEEEEEDIENRVGFAGKKNMVQSINERERDRERSVRESHQPHIKKKTTYNRGVRH